MSRRLAGAILALVFAGSSGLLAIRNKPQQADAAKASPEAPAQEAVNSGLEHLEKGRLSDAKQAYMYLFVHDRTASHVLMKAMKTWVEKRRAQPGGIDAATIEAFGAWVRERDALAAAVVNMGHNSPDWK